MRQRLRTQRPERPRRSRLSALVGFIGVPHDPVLAGGWALGQLLAVLDGGYVEYRCTSVGHPGPISDSSQQRPPHRSFAGAYPYSTGMRCRPATAPDELRSHRIPHTKAAHARRSIRTRTGIALADCPPAPVTLVVALLERGRGAVWVGWLRDAEARAARAARVRSSSWLVRSKAPSSLDDPIEEWRCANPAGILHDILVRVW
jgi:hypothetical protein